MFNTWMYLTIWLAFGHQLRNAYAGELIALQTFKNYSRIILNIDGSVSSRWKKSDQGFEVLLPGSHFIDLGIGPGEVDGVRKKVLRLADSRVSGLNLIESEDGLRFVGRWKFPAGKQTMAQPVMDTFDFSEKNPPRLVVDFWVRPGLTLSQFQSLKQKQALEAALKRMQDEEKNRSSRQLASAERSAEIKDLDRFCSQPVTEKNDFFLRFHPIHKGFDFSKWLPAANADSNFDYFQPEGKSREAQHVRLAKKLYLGSKFALAIRTIDFLESEYPTSQFLIEMKFLKANALIKLGQVENGEFILNQLVRDYRKSPVAVHSAMFMALKFTQRRSSSLALEKFLWLIDNYSNHRLSWIFHLGAAECLYELGQTDRANKEYRWLMENGPSPEEGAEAAFRIGDLYLRKMQYERALGTYYQGIQHFEGFGGKFPEYYLNRGEALYQLGQLDKAKQEFLQFLERFPSHSAGWRATFRLAEIAGRDPKGTGPRSTEYQDYLLKTVNRYPVSPGAVIARIRLIACGDHGGFDLPSQEKFFAEQAKSFDGDGAVMMVDYPDFRALAHMRALVTYGGSIKTLELALEELKTARSTLVRSFLKSAAHDSFQKLILQLMNEGKSYEALSFYSAKAPSMPPTDEEIDREYLLKLSQVASDLELGKMADDLLQAYKKPIGAKRTLAAASTEPKSRREEQNYALAKALWIKFKNMPDKKNVKVGESIDQIKGLLAGLSSDSKFTFDKEVMLGLIAEYEGKLELAIQHAAQARLIHDQARLDAWLASLYSRVKNNSTALSILSALEKLNLDSSKARTPQESLLQNLGLPSAPDVSQAVFNQVQILESESRWGEVASAYSRLMDYGIKSNRVLYGYARSLVQLGKEADRPQAIQVLNEIIKTEPKNQDESFWKNLAIETLANEKTHESIKKNAKEGTI